MLILDCRTDLALLRERLAVRIREGRDPSDADLDVLAGQLARHDVLTATELRETVIVHTGRELPEEAARRVAALVEASQ